MKVADPCFYRKRTLKEVKARTQVLVEAGIQRVFLASGWMGYEVPEFYYDCIHSIKEDSNLDVYGLFGALNRTSLLNLKRAGMDGYLCGLESPNEAIYKRFRPAGDTLTDRISALKTAKGLNLKIWSGFLVGLGETDEDVSVGLEILRGLEPESLSILPFTPFPNTEMWDENPANPLKWARAMAIARTYLRKPDLFSDQTEGFYQGYGILGGANGFYSFPGKKSLFQSLERSGA
ncbi:radical SAM protein [Desulfosporosinus sp. BG]|uniref:radical SAM protein n=1 Tax=Desulfosporosinus sp. BG TaxID=1633135 RepID=UPI000839DF61|nr:radical SAM protein [Desulfosporosinus sp. BG]ODA42027.1 Biotin synthase [Desulfosporosinus sp. BG]